LAMPCSLAIDDGVLTAVGRPNDALGPRGRKWAIGVVSVFALLVGTAWTLLGAWPVLPFVGLEVLCLAGAWVLIGWHASDYEYVVIGRGRVSVDRRNGAKVERHEFQAAWTRVEQGVDDRGRCRVRLCSSGRDVEVGVWLPADDRGDFADALRQHLRLHGGPL